MSRTPEVSTRDLATALEADGTVVIDVREPAEYVGGHVPGARSVPLRQLPAELDRIDRSQRVYVVCAAGGRSKAATDVMRVAGVDAVSVSGGTDAWRGSGRPVVVGHHAG